MKKNIVLIIFILFLTAIFSVSTVSGEEEITLQNLETTYINKIDFTHADLNLTLEEIHAVEKYQNEAVNFGLYEIDGYYQELNSIEFGIHYQTMKQIERVFNTNISYVTEDFETIMVDYYAGNFDLVPGLIKTGNREDEFYFSNYNVAADIYLFSNSYIDIYDVYDLDDIVIAKQTGMKIISDEYVDYLDSRGIEITIIDYDNITDAVEDLGISIDYIIHSKNIDLIQQGLNFIDAADFLNGYELYLTSKIDDDLIYFMSAVDKAFDYGLEENIIEYGEQLEALSFESGTYFSAEELAFIQNTKENPIKVTSASKWIPYLYENESGALEGYGYDIFLALTANLGLSYEFEYDPTLSWNDMLDTLGRNSNEIEYDMAILDSVTNYEDDFGVYSYPIRTEEVYVVGLSGTPLLESLFDLNSKKVGIIPFYSATTYLETNLVFKDFYVYDNLDDMVQALKNGEIEYFALIKSEYEGLYYMQKNYDIFPKFTIRENFDVAMLFPEQGENTELLLSLYNKALQLSDTEYVSDEYFYMQVDLNEVVQKRTVNIIVGLVSLIIIVTGAGLYWYFVVLRKRLMHDELTKQLNRKALFTQANITNFQYLYYFDFDNFKDINDQFGHKTGDNVLVQISNTIKDNFEGELYRLGGDEFVLLSSNKYEIIDLRGSNFVFIEDNMDISITFSIGAVHIKKYNSLSLDELVRYADIAMYEAKKQGGNKLIYVYDELITKYEKSLLDPSSRNQSR